MSIDFPKEEERILARWKEIDAFLTQVELVSGHLVASRTEARPFSSSGNKQDALRSREF
jgi:isoleucyl-tRNA synthetase